MAVKFGQNFLSDPSWQKKIVAWFEPEGFVVEIGPGRGALTKHLSKKFTDFCVIEIDRRLEEIHQNQPYEFLRMDFLDWDFFSRGKELRSFSVISNLPYDVGTKILERMVEESARIPHFVVMLQKEVAERVTAVPKTRAFGSLSVLVQGAYQVEMLGTLPPGAFSPPPKVYSSVIRGRRLAEPLVPHTPEFRAFVRKAFLHKRKTLSNSLKSFIDKNLVAPALEAAEIPPLARAEELDLLKWARLYKVLIEEKKAL
jgi:16S rRNA (adenine1518-N6/adenine1519-N6)-dimethyltransferase